MVEYGLLKPSLMLAKLLPIFKEINCFVKFLGSYIQSKVIYLAHWFEKVKNTLVDLLMFRRGVLQKRVWHASMIGLSIFGIITSGIFGGQTIVSSTFPGVTAPDPRFAQAFEPSTEDPILNSLYDTHTTISQKPRAEIIEYEVESGDTISSIGVKFDISIDTVKWANDLADADTIKPGQRLKILPVSGISHKVVSGDTLESVAKKYSAESQAILDFPFNDVADDFKLKIGQVLIVPDGTPVRVAPKRPVYSSPSLARGPSSSATFSAPGGANFIWPTQGGITQYFAWYHQGADIANRNAPGVVASDGGTVIVAGWPDNYGFGNRVVIDHGNGYQTLYAHLSNIYVSSGQKVSRGEVVGQMGSTGRSTGTHLHFEIRYRGLAVNPLAILK